MARSWGSSSDWFLDLRDGRHLRIPVDLSATMSESPQEEALAQKLLQWVSEKREESETGEEEFGFEWDLGDSVDGSDLDGGNDITSPTRSEIDSALIAFTGGECSESTHPETLALTVGGD